MTKFYRIEGEGYFPINAESAPVTQAGSVLHQGA